MHSFLKSFLVGAAFCSMALSSAQAEVFFIEDQNDRFTVTFPDLWKKIGNQKTDDKLTVVGPGSNDFANCRVRVRGDRRYVIFPNKFGSAIQKVSFSKEFWNNYLGEYDDVSVDVFKDEAALGLGHASMVEVSYETAEGPLVHKRGIMFATLYYDQVYIVDCSSEASVYSKWRSEFLGIVKSVDFKKMQFEKSSGHYRDFQDDKPVEVTGPRELDVYKF
ncbi:MAG: hypothetical protein COA45_03530 [Zetaproteobacteria bacterium]|nr:MAG: hypothetical protein COA45_03530 [Zetaproteobacteria bacterium]